MKPGAIFVVTLKEELVDALFIMVQKIHCAA
jgi:hypothetical protein